MGVGGVEMAQHCQRRAEFLLPGTIVSYHLLLQNEHLHPWAKVGSRLAGLISISRGAQKSVSKTEGSSLHPESGPCLWRRRAGTTRVPSPFLTCSPRGLTHTPPCLASVPFTSIPSRMPSSTPRDWGGHTAPPTPTGHPTPCHPGPRAQHP